MLKTLITIVVFVVFLFSDAVTKQNYAIKQILNTFTFRIWKKQVV